MPPPPSRGYVKWYGDRQAAGLEQALYRGLQKAAAYGRTEIVKEISTSARAGGGGRRRPTKGGKGRPMRFKRSSPGSPPRRDTGALARSIFWSADRRMMIATVGTKLKYGVYLELGAIIPSRRPVRKKYMVWGRKTPVIGRRGKKQWWVFAKKAKGFRLAARPYVLKTLRDRKPQITAMIFAEAKAFSARGGVSVG